MNRTEETKFREQIDQWNDADEFSRCIEAIEAIPEQERGYLLTVKLSRAYSNLAVLGDHSAHGSDGEVDGELLGHAIELLESVRTQGENDPYWNARMGYSCLMAYGSATTAYEYAKCWLSLAPDDPDAQEPVSYTHLRFMRYREIPASGAVVCRKGGIDHNVLRHEHLYKLCTIP